MARDLLERVDLADYVVALFLVGTEQPLQRVLVPASGVLGDKDEREAAWNEWNMF